MDIVFEDDFIVIVNKRPGILVVPTPKNEKYTLTNLLNEEFKKKGSSVNPAPVCRGGVKILPCHRLDRDTSGLIIYAKGREVQEKVMEEFRKGRIKKTYIAFAQGRISRNAGTIGYPIEGKTAITQYKVLKIDARGFSVAGVHTLTGRTNQIRIHFKMIGHPLLGERKFAFGKDYKLKFRRTALHASGISFKHPVLREILSFKADLPKDMKDFLNK